MTQIDRKIFSISKLGFRILNRLFKVSVNVYGREDIPDGAIIFVVNHFTRLETVILPYELYQLTGKPVMTLGHHSLFQRALGTYLKNLGAVSTKDPNRDSIIIRSLLKGDHPWLIFPEGAMIKDKKVIKNGRFQIYSGNGARRPPHTGAAALALRTEFYRQRIRYLQQIDSALLQKQLAVLNLNSSAEVTHRQTYLVPINLSYYPIRPRKNIFEKMAAAAMKEVPKRMQDELRTEGTMLLSGVNMNINIGKPLAVRPWLAKNRIHKDLKNFQLIQPDDILPSKPRMHWVAKKLTAKALASIYRYTTVNFDHLAAYLIKYYPGRSLSATELTNRLCLALKVSNRLKSLRLHPSLLSQNGGRSCNYNQNKLVDFLKAAEQSGVIELKGEMIYKKRLPRSAAHDFHSIRMANPYQVILNEVEYLHDLTRRLRMIACYPGWLLHWLLQRHHLSAVQPCILSAPPSA